ncbi:MAG: UDP-3-O-(3-hydroxymyristoyl)glucosamine N-acyltransferase, partial [Methylophaga sp.]
GHIEICDGVQFTGMSMVTKSISQPGSYSSGIPVEPTHDWHKSVIRYRQLEKLQARVKALEALLAEKLS